MAQTLYPEYVFTEDTKKEFFQATDGNPFFITEAVNNLRYNVSPTELTPKIRNILQQRIEPLPEECRKSWILFPFFSTASPSAAYL